MTSVLVVDDEPALRSLVADLLMDVGYLVSLAGDGGEALDRLRHMRPDVLLLDLTMPGIDGWSVLEALAANRASRRLPVGIMSGARTVERAIPHSGVVRMIAKPFDLEDLLQTVQELATHSAVSYTTLHPDFPRKRSRPPLTSTL